MHTKIDRLLELLESNPEIADALLEAGEELARVVNDVTPERPGDLGEIEERIERTVDEVARLAVRKVLQRMAPVASLVEHDGRLWRRVKDATLGTCFSRRGPVEFERHLYRDVSRRNGPTIAPAEQVGGLIDGRWTPKAAEAVCDLLQKETAREAETTSVRLGILPYSAAAFGRVAELVGTEWDEHRAGIENDLMASYEVSPETVAVSLAADRVSVPMRARVEGKFRMAYCGVVTMHDKDGEPLDSFRYGWMPKPSVSENLADAMRGDLNALMKKRPNLRIVVLSDGAHEMKGLLEQAVEGLDGVERALDFWHAVEHIAAVARALGLDAKEEVRTAKATLLEHDDGAERLVQRVAGWGKRTRRREGKEEVRKALTYLQNNADRMSYRRLRDANLPIGSGHVEATCKTLVSVRMKRAGAQWSMVGGQAILGLRSLARSSRWDGGMKRLLGRWVKPVTVRAT